MPIREADLIVPTLRLLSQSPSGFMTTADLIAALEDHFAPIGVDAMQLQGRNDSHFSQKVRNLVSHRENSTGLEARGLATYDKAREGWRIEDAGRRLLETIDASA